MSQSTNIVTAIIENLALYMVYGVTDPTGLVEYVKVDDLPGFRENEQVVTNAEVATFFNMVGPNRIYTLDLSGPQYWNILFERYAQPFVEIEERPDIRFARIALYEDAETTTETVNDARAHFSEQLYGLDISVIRAYSKDNETRGELPLLALRDKIVDWAQRVNVQVLTNNYLYTFTYSGASPIVRDDKFVSRTLTFTARRDLYKPQIT
jgi:hypothetical protein